MQAKKINEPSRETPLWGEYEVVVLGGGPAGLAAALAAARAGRSTIIVERYGFFGGAGTAAGLSTFCGLHAVVHGNHEAVNPAQVGTKAAAHYHLTLGPGESRTVLLRLRDAMAQHAVEVVPAHAIPASKHAAGHFPPQPGAQKSWFKIASVRRQISRP